MKHRIFGAVVCVACTGPRRLKSMTGPGWVLLLLALLALLAPAAANADLTLDARGRRAIGSPRPLPQSARGDAPSSLEHSPPGTRIVAHGQGVARRLTARPGWSPSNTTLAGCASGSDLDWQGRLLLIPRLGH